MRLTVAELMNRVTGASFMGKDTGGRRIDDAEIRARAYELYRDRGEEHGHDVDDWLRAEEEIERQYHWQIPRGYP